MMKRYAQLDALSIFTVEHIPKELKQVGSIADLYARDIAHLDNETRDGLSNIYEFKSDDGQSCALLDIEGDGQMWFFVAPTEDGIQGVLDVVEGDDDDE